MNIQTGHFCINLTFLFFSACSPAQEHVEGYLLQTPELLFEQGKFKDEPVNLEDVSQLLWAAYGVTKEFVFNIFFNFKNFNVNL